MQTYNFNWKNAQGKTIFGQGWLPNTQAPKGVVLLVHGLGEHIGRYAHLAHFFTQKGWALLASDRIGHGQSEGQRGHTPQYEALFKEIDQLLAESQRKFNSLPTFLYGHSMGGNLVLNYMIQNPKVPIKGVIATSSALRLAFEPPAIQLFLGKLMRKIYPAFSQGNGLEVQALSQDPKVVQAYQNDPLVHDKISAETAIGMIEWGQKALANAQQLQTPALLVHGSADRICSPLGSRQFAETSPLADLKLWEAGYHELHNEAFQEELFAYIWQWMQAQQ
ncbi:lysophospholipase [Saprospira sp. CCB-QB6]|uniref:alpha/beta hydrolase n=1 Tax=Saprospira sp. CCB-QB6 TaxID=3023936 RepID=UPI00234B5F2F|nr:alpha/beta hydrolase [Saprospira sp. CCB-QB6]WCL80159.1 lysophospholipase [Saprospira sp. CCB-QB6]